MMARNFLQTLLKKNKVKNIVPDMLIYTALCTYGLCSDTEQSEEAILNSISKNEFQLPLKWCQAIFAYLCQYVSLLLANEWDKYCLQSGIVLFTNTELDSERKEYLCSKEADMNICRIILNLDFSYMESLPWQLRFINEDESSLIKESLPLLAKLTKL